MQGGGAEQTVLLTDARPSSAIENGWQRVTATFTAPAASCRIAFRMSGCTGTAYLDDLQLEQADPLAPGDTASVRLRVHPVVPGHFEQEADLIAEGYDLPVRISVKGFGQNK